MKTMPSLRRQHYATRVSIFLTIAALIAAMVGCAQPAVLSYDLTVASTAGGSVTIPGEGTSTYDEGTVVNLVGTADSGYKFVNWTGDVSTVGDADSAATTIVMNDAYSLTANFVREQYDLTTTSTAGGSIIMPGEGTFTYHEGTVVNLAAEAEESNKFVDWTGDVSTISDLNAVQTTITMDGSYSITANFESKYTPMVAGGAFQTLGLKADGTVVAVGYNEYAQCVVAHWTDVIQVLGGRYHTVGLEGDGTLLTTGWNDYGQLNVGDWTDIIEVTGSFLHTVGLKADGGVMAVGHNEYRQCDVGDWTDIVQVAAGGYHTVGLRADGTVIAVGSDDWGQCDIGDWTDIVQVMAGYHHTVAIRADGTVVAVGGNLVGQCDVGDWTDIIQVAAGYHHTLGLKADGTVVAVGSDTSGQCSVGDWADIIWVGAGYHHTVGLKADGTTIAVGSNQYGQCHVDDWDLF